ncbi:hypothetical protein HYY75_13120 [bacterium]|nr:hypothetical protein [bacterium]
MSFLSKISSNPNLTVNKTFEKNLVLGACFFLFLCTVFCNRLFAGEFSFFYERAFQDSYGNDIAFQTQKIDSIEDIPEGSPWRTYLSQMVGSKTLFSYAKDLSPLLSQPMQVTVSDRNLVSSSSKDPTGYKIDLYKSVTQYSSESSRKFVFLHELGHVAMLNGYPASYNFSGLSYGPDGAHYLDEILPNANTAWVEGWANGFAALKNDGKVFSLDLKSETVLAFLKVKSYEEMTRNELFVGKMLFDISMMLPSGKDKMFSAISRTGPHYSLRDFARGYLSLYPQDQIGLAKLLDKNSQGKISQTELLDYVNGGSNTVNSAFYSYLQERRNTTISQGTPQPTKKSFWASIFSFFSNLFGRASSPKPPTPYVSENLSPRLTVSPSSNLSSANLQSGTSLQTSDEKNVFEENDLATAQEAYYKAFADYNSAISAKSPESQDVKMAYESLQTAKTRLSKIKSSMKR